MQPTRQPTPPRVQHEASNPLCNPPATPPTPLRPLPSAPCPDSCGEGYLVTSGPGYFDLHEECWMPNDEIDPCPTCRGTGRQPSDGDDPNQPGTDLQPERNQDPYADGDDLPRLPF